MFTTQNMMTEKGERRRKEGLWKGECLSLLAASLPERLPFGATFQVENEHVIRNVKSRPSQTESDQSNQSTQSVSLQWQKSRLCRTGNVHTQKKIANENEIKWRKCKYTHIQSQAHCLWGVFYSFPPHSLNNEQHKKLCIKIFCCCCCYFFACISVTRKTEFACDICGWVL